MEILNIMAIWINIIGVILSGSIYFGFPDLVLNDLGEVRAESMLIGTIGWFLIAHLLQRGGEKVKNSFSSWKKEREFRRFKAEYLKSIGK